MMDTKVIDVALGKKSADMVILNGNLINVHTREVYQSDVSIVDGKIAGVGKLPEGVIGPDTQIIDAAGKYLSPDSSMPIFTSKAVCSPLPSSRTQSSKEELLLSLPISWKSQSLQAWKG